jgi:hypothetical protein
VIILTSRSKQFQFERVEVFLSPSVRAMLQKQCCEAANVRVVKRALFITRNSLKSHGTAVLPMRIRNPAIHDAIYYRESHWQNRVLRKDLH